MSCTRPLLAQTYLEPITATTAVRFKNFEGEPNLEIPCNKCLSCKLRKAKEWALRCWHESQMHEQSCNVTLTYAPEHLPEYENLDHRDFQLFMKRLRKNTGKKVSYFMCGEYGDEKHRPHFHVILYGYYPPDAVYHRTSEKGHRYYKSEQLDKYWKCGFTDTTNVSYNNAGYIARYTLKKQLPQEDTQDRYTYFDTNGDLQTRKFEYVRMSTDPAIGLSWFKKYAEHVCSHDYVLDPNGYKCPVPKYYLDQLKLDSPKWHAHLAALRLEKAKERPDKGPSNLQREICMEAKAKQLIRPYL